MSELESNIDSSSATSVDTQAKALTINMDPKVYGTFAEIGAGQEIAGWFFKVGGAAGTVAKTMSAYDMTVSDDIYGKTTQYVSEDRLKAMLTHEYGLLNQRLNDKFGKEKTFFVLADTVSARNYKGTNECHGWIGLRHQESSESEPVDILLHVNLLDSSNFAQQEALGILGVNLIYAANYLKNDLQTFLKSLLDDLTNKRIEIDTVYFEGGEFSQISSKDIGLEILYSGLSPAIVLTKDQKLIQPSAAIRKRPILIERGAYRLLRNIGHDSINEAKKHVRSGDPTKPSEILINELSIKSVQQSSEIKRNEMSDLISNAIINCEDYMLISSFTWYYDISHYLRRHTKEQLGFVMGISTLMKLFNEKFYDETSGTLLEALGKLLAIGAKVYVYPMTKESLNTSDQGSTTWSIKDKDNITLEDITPEGAIKHLFNYLTQSNYVVSV